MHRIPFAKYLLIALGIISLQAFVLYVMGRPPLCTCGTFRLWVGTVASPENSQQLTDWYTFTHIIHGFLLYGLMTWIAPKSPLGLRLALAIGVESSWEMIENSPIIINRYRQSSLAQGYFGDSILNSISDTLSAAFGFFLASKLPVKWTVALALTMELILGYVIHDNLTLNILQLIYPNPAISHWQEGK